MKKIYLKWKDIDKATDNLAKQIIKSKLEISAIYGCPRGGLIPAVILSHKLGVPFLKEDDGETLVDENTLIIDDICDTGETLSQYSEFPSVLTATIHYKPTAMFKPDFYWNTVTEDEWIVYPWEQKDSQTIPDYATERK